MVARIRKRPSERRADLIAVTAEIILERGFSAATTRDVTQRAGVGTGLLNHYFAWDELRCLGFESVARTGTAYALPDDGVRRPLRAMKRMIKDAFASESDAFWRAWVEAIEEAGSDPELARIVGACASDFRERLEQLLEAGNESKVWTCRDPTGAAWRILAMHDGLVGFVFSGAPPLSRRAATAHLRVAVAHELDGQPKL